MENVKLRALGAHQQDNALTAISSILALRVQGTSMHNFYFYFVEGWAPWHEACLTFIYPY